MNFFVIQNNRGDSIGKRKQKKQGRNLQTAAYMLLRHLSRPGILLARVYVKYRKLALTTAGGYCTKYLKSHGKIVIYNDKKIVSQREAFENCNLMGMNHH